MRLLEPIPDDKVTVELKMGRSCFYGLDDSTKGFYKVHINGFIGHYGPVINHEGVDYLDNSKEHFMYFLIGFSVVKIVVVPENE